MYLKYTVLIVLCFVFCIFCSEAVVADCLPGNQIPVLTCDTPEEDCTWPHYETIDYSFSGSVFDHDGFIVKFLYRRTNEDAFESVPFYENSYDFRAVLRAGENRVTLCAIDDEGCSVFLERCIWGEDSIPSECMMWDSVKAIYR